MPLNGGKRSLPMLAHKWTTLVGIAGIISSVTFSSLPMVSISLEAVGGWSENENSAPAIQSRSAVAPFAKSSVSHRGKAETKSIRGTSHKRSHGWTSWRGVTHYTTARLEHYWPYTGVIASSGRQWGHGRSEAKTKWVAFNPDAASSGFGKAHTYYGRGKR